MYLNGTENTKWYFYYYFHEMQNFDVVLSLSNLKKDMCSTDDSQNVLGNISVEVRNNLNFVKNMLKKTPPSEFHTHEI